MIDTTPVLNKESLRVALLSFCISADKGTEEISIFQTFSRNRDLFLSFVHKHLSRIRVKFEITLDTACQCAWIVIGGHMEENTVCLTYFGKKFSLSPSGRSLYFILSFVTNVSQAS